MDYYKTISYNWVVICEGISNTEMFVITTLYVNNYLLGVHDQADKEGIAW